jgi:uncharacterized protein with von Willebrand factor type A (vWA) domain
MDKWPRRIFDDECREGGFIADALTARPEDQWPSFCRELFGRLYGVGCEKLDTPKAGAEWASELHAQAEAIPEWTQLFTNTRGDAWRSALVAAQAANVLAPAMPKIPEQNIDALEARRDTMLEILDNTTGAQHNAAAKEYAKIGDALAEAKHVAETALEALRAGNGFATRSTLRKAARVAADALAEVDAAMQGLGAGSEASALTKRAMLSTILNDDRIRRIAALAGRLRLQAAQKQRTKVTQERSEIVSVTKGDDLQRLLASEVGLLSAPATRPFVLERIAEKRALQYELGGKATKTRGPIVFVIDKSSSMATGARDEWAAAAALAIMEIARIQRRPFAVAFFNGGVQERYFFEPNDTSPERLLAILGVRPSGGTDIGKALEWAHGVVAGTDGAAQWPHGSKSDVLVITDGDDKSDVATPIAKLKTEGASIYVIAIECEPRQSLREAATETVRVSHADFAGANPKLNGVFSI